MGWLHDDRLLWLGIVTSSVAVTWACFHALDTLDAATESSASSSSASQLTRTSAATSSASSALANKQFCVVNQRTEDDIAAADLATLARHPVRHIAEAAIKILVLRCSHDDLLIAAVERDFLVASEACRGDSHGVDGVNGSRGSDYDASSNATALSRVVKAKRLMRRYDADCFERWHRKYLPHRTAATVDAPPLSLLPLAVREIVEEGAEETIEDLLGDIDVFARQSATGGVEEDTESDSSSSDSDSDSGSSEGGEDSDEDEDDDAQNGTASSESWDAAWLALPPDMRHTIASEQSLNHDDGLQSDHTTNTTERQLPRSRARAASPEEQARRRRRREAIVLNEGNRPLTQQNIIQRRTTQND